jgi:regulatory protein
MRAMADGADDAIRWQPTQRDPMRVMLRVGGKVMATLPRASAEDVGAVAGAIWTGDLAERVAAAVDADKATRYALRALERRALSSGELRDRMQRRGHGEAAVEQTLSYLLERRYIDDQAYAESVIRSLRSRKPAGPRLLRHKLYQKRLPAAVIDRALAEAADADGDVEQARAYAASRLKLPSVQRLDARTRQRRLWSALARRGFDTQVIRAALTHLLDEDS